MSPTSFENCIAQSLGHLQSLKTLKSRKRRKIEAKCWKILFLFAYAFGRGFPMFFAWAFSPYFPEILGVRRDKNPCFFWWFSLPFPKIASKGMVARVIVSSLIKMIKILCFAFFRDHWITIFVCMRGWSWEYKTGEVFCLQWWSFFAYK